MQDLLSEQPRCRKSHARLLLDCLVIATGVRAAVMLDYEPKLRHGSAAQLCTRLSSASSTAVVALRWQGSLWLVQLEALLRRCTQELYGCEQHGPQLVLFDASDQLQVTCMPLLQHVVRPYHAVKIEVVLNE